MAFKSDVGSELANVPIPLHATCIAGREAGPLVLNGCFGRPDTNLEVGSAVPDLPQPVQKLIISSDATERGLFADGPATGSGPDTARFFVSALGFLGSCPLFLLPVATIILSILRSGRRSRNDNHHHFLLGGRAHSVLGFLN